MFAVYLTTLLCCLAVSHSAVSHSAVSHSAVSHSAPSCEDLLQPLDQVDFQHLRGGWAVIGGISNTQTHLDNFNKRERASVIFGDSGNSSAVPVTVAFSENGTCRYLNTIVTFEGSSFKLEQTGEPGTFLKTSCDDCLLAELHKEAEVRLYLFGRRREVEQKVMEEFTAQAACLNMTSPLVKDPSTALCPEQISVDPTPKPE